MKKHLLDIIIDMCVVICAAIWAYVAALFSWLIIDFYSAIWYIISRKRGKTMHKKNIFDLFNEQHPDPAKDPAPDNVVKAADVRQDIVKPEDTKPEDVKPEDAKPEDTKPDPAANENADEAERGKDNV